MTHILKHLNSNTFKIKRLTGVISSWHIIQFKRHTLRIIMSHPWQNQQNDCVPMRRLRSAWASAKSNQSLCCVLNGQLRTQAFFMRTVKTLWPDWADAQADLSLCWAHMPFCWFCNEVAHIINVKTSTHNRAWHLITISNVYVRCLLSLRITNIIRWNPGDMLPLSAHGLFWWHSILSNWSFLICFFR